MKLLRLVSFQFLLVLSGCAEVGVQKGEQGLAALRAGDCDTAINLFKQSEKAGEACSSNNLGVIYATGCPAAKLAPDPTRAREQYVAAAAHGCAMGYANVGDMYARGDGVAQDSTEAARWYDLGARWGDPASIARLQKLGNVPPDPDLLNNEIAHRQQQVADRAAVAAAMIGAMSANQTRQTVAAPGCNTDLDCGIGKVCMRAQQQVGLVGTCVTPVNNFGSQLVTVPQGHATNVNGCSFDTQCGVGFHCLKQPNELYGICVK